MGWKLDKTKRELKEFYDEIIVENGPRYKDPKEWPHLYVDFWVSLCSMSYTMGHILAFIVPIAIILLV
jgi:hypothetical protein